MTTKYNYFFKKTILWSTFLVPTLLLSTPNFSVGVIVILILSSISYLLYNRRNLVLNSFDFLVIICFSTYFLGAIPVAILDGSTTRYFQGGARLLLCLPIYLALSQTLKTTTLELRKNLEFGVIVGSLSTFVLSIYQFFYLSMPRVDGFLFSINFGYLACSLAFLSLSLCFQSERRHWLVVAFIVSVISVTLTLTRGAIFAIPLLLIICLLFYVKKLNYKLVAICSAIFIGCCILTYNYSSSFKQRIDFTVFEFTSIAKGEVGRALSSGDRLQYWIGATEAFKKSPLIGLPYSDREQLNHELYLAGKINERASGITRGHAHNQYFEMIASNGTLGIISILAIFVVPLAIMILHFRNSTSTWAFPGAIFVSGFIIFGLTEVPLTANLIGSFYGFMLAVFLANISAEKHRSKQKEKQ